MENLDTLQLINQDNDIKIQEKIDHRITSVDEAVELGIKAEEKFKKAYTFQQGREANLVENMAFYQGNQYELSTYRSNRSWVVEMNTPYSSLAIDTRTSSLKANNYLGDLQAYKESDVESINQLKFLVNDVWEYTNLNELINSAIDYSAVVREAYVHIYVNPNVDMNEDANGEFKAYILDTACVWLDPNARNFDECKYIFVTGRIDKDEALLRYPILKQLDKSIANGTTKERGEIYKGNDYHTSQDDIITQKILYEKKWDKEKENYTIFKSTIIGGLVVEKQQLNLKQFPIAQLRWKKQHGSAYGLSLMDDLVSLQKSINAIESSITNTAISFSSPAYIVKKESGLDPRFVAKTAGLPGVVYVVSGDINDPIRPMTLSPLNDSIIGIKAQYENTINKIAGVSSEYVGSIGTSGNTAEGSRIAVERAKIIENNVLSNISLFVEQLVRIIVDYLPLVYEEGSEVMLRVTSTTENKDNFEPRKVPININELNYKFYVDLSTRTKSAIDQSKRELLELYQLQHQYDDSIKVINQLDVLEQSGLKNVDELKERYQRLLIQDTETKTNTIIELTMKAVEFGIPQELLQGAINEIISSQEQTPMLDEVMAMLQQNVQEEQQLAEQQAIEEQDMLVQQEAMQQLPI